MTVVEARAKINLYLRVTGKRADGYHLLDTLFQEINLADQLTFTPGDTPIELKVSGADLGDTADNLVIRVANSFGEVTGCRVGGRFDLVKQIPAGGGLGGGSADAAAALKLLNHHFGQPLDRQQLVALGVGLGADIPFFFFGGCARGRGIGELLEPSVAPDCPHGGFLLLPGMPIATPAVFKALRLQDHNRGAAELGENDLLAPALAVSPSFARVYEALQALFPIETLFMSGSGSTVVLLTQRATLNPAELAELADLGVRHQHFHFVGADPA